MIPKCLPIWPQALARNEESQVELGISYCKRRLSLELHFELYYYIRIGGEIRKWDESEKK